MRTSTRLLAALALAASSSLGCAGASEKATIATPAIDRSGEAKRIEAALDDFHDAAAKADETRYFGHLAMNGVFLGTDATERWDKAAFAKWAHPHFAKGKAWSFRASRRVVTLSERGDVAWFDEDLVTEKLGPCRGSGVLVREGGDWRIAQYNLALTVPNEKFDGVKALLEAR